MSNNPNAHLFYGVVVTLANTEDPDDDYDHTRTEQLLNDRLAVLSEGDYPIEILKTGYSYEGPVVLSLQSLARVAYEWDILRLPDANKPTDEEARAIVLAWCEKLGLKANEHDEPGWHLHVMGGEG